MIKKYDILIFVETKTDEFDENNLPGVKQRIFVYKEIGWYNNHL
jgi:hypothetical protein